MRLCSYILLSVSAHLSSSFSVRFLLFNFTKQKNPYINKTVNCKSANINDQMYVVSCDIKSQYHDDGERRLYLVAALGFRSNAFSSHIFMRQYFDEIALNDHFLDFQLKSKVKKWMLVLWLFVIIENSLEKVVRRNEHLDISNKHRW